MLGRYLSVTDGREQIFYFAGSIVRQQSQNLFVLEQVLGVLLILSGLLFEHFAAELDGLLTFLLVEPVSNLVSGAGGFDEGQPIPAWFMARLRNNFDDVAICQLGLQRQHPGIDLRSYTGVTDLGVNGVGEVDGSGVARQSDDLAFWCKGVDLFGIQVDLQRTEKIGRILHVLLQFHKMAQPRDAPIFAIVSDQLAVLVFPVRCYAFFSDAMHVRGSNLYFERLPAGDHRSVQRLVHIRPWHRDKILDAARNRHPDVVNDTKSRITILDAVGDDS